ncbi:DUF4351 domain-containing protein [Bordetella tumbae]|uniref:Rpn family recombination-promoting nuclease/putative transposase n=1 Tax=Bordetella tumbae TaxID=1649139 RepID=UPI0039EFFEF9
MARRADYDSAWKDALSAYFPEFLGMLHPCVHARIDWTHMPKFLDKELQALIRGTVRGRLLVDKLVSVRLLDGQEAWLLIHVEVQARCDSEFTRRMFDYHVRLKSNYPESRLLNMAVLTGRNSHGLDRLQAGVGAMCYAYDEAGCELRFTFPVIRLEWWRSRMAELRELAENNLFAVVVLAQLEATANGHARDRLLRKIELVRHLEQWKVPRDNRRTLFRVIDAMLYLPEELEPEFDAAITTIEEEQKMAYVTSIERVRSKQARAEGLKEGLERGREQGFEQGQRQGTAKSLTTLVMAKFGALPDWAQVRINEADEASLQKWMLRLLDAERIEDVFI